jgi:hypothetical protein
MLICYPERREESQAALPVRRTRCRARASAAMLMRRSPFPYVGYHSARRSSFRAFLSSGAPQEFSAVLPCRRVFVVPCVGRRSAPSCHPARRDGPQLCRPAIGCVVVLMRRLPCRVSVVVPRVGRRAHASAAIPCLPVIRHAAKGLSRVVRPSGALSCACAGRRAARRSPFCVFPSSDAPRRALSYVALPPGVCRAMCRPPCRASAAIPCLPVIRHAAKGLSRVVRPSDALPCSCAGRRAMRRLPFHAFLLFGASRRIPSRSACLSDTLPCVGRRAARRSSCYAPAIIPRAPVIRRAAKGPQPCRPAIGCAVVLMRRSPCRASVAVPMRQLPRAMRRPPFCAFPSSGASRRVPDRIVLPPDVLPCSCAGCRAMRRLPFHVFLLSRVSRRVQNRVCPAIGCAAVLMRRSPCHASAAIPRFSVIQSVATGPKSCLPCHRVRYRAARRSSCYAPAIIPRTLVIRRAAKGPQLCYPAVSCRRVFAMLHTGRRAHASTAVPRALAILSAAKDPHLLRLSAGRAAMCCLCAVMRCQCRCLCAAHTAPLVSPPTPRRLCAAVRSLSCHSCAHGVSCCQDTTLSVL